MIKINYIIKWCDQECQKLGTSPNKCIKLFCSSFTCSEKEKSANSVKIKSWIQLLTSLLLSKYPYNC